MRRVLLLAMVAVLVAGTAMAQSNPTARRINPPAQSKVQDPPPGPGEVNLVGGPDGFGYTFIDTQEPMGCDFQFVDIAVSGTIVPGASADDGVGTVALSEPFTFYGAAFNSVVMDSNGLLSFNPAHASDLSNTCPLPEGVDPRIGVVWDDLDLDGVNTPGQSARQQYFPVCPRPNDINGSPEGCTVFQWDEAEHFSTTPPFVVFDSQAILYHTTGEIVMQWDDRNTEAGSGSTTGTQSSPNSLTYACNVGGSLPANSGVCFFPPLSGAGDLALTKTVDNAAPGVGQNVTFTITVSITGGDNTGVTVTDVLPAPLVYVSDTCGGDFADGQWDIGALTDGQSVSCDIVATYTACAAVVNTATVTADDFEPPGNNTDSVTVGSESIADGSFETGSPNAAWTEASTNFGTPLCTVAGCGTGTGTGPRTGLWWAWFGGFGGGVETGSVSQSVTIPVGTATLTFWLEQIVCDSAADFMEVRVDGNMVFRTDGASALCGVLGYSMQTVDVSAFADGGSHTISFNSTTVSANAGVTNFFVDDVSLVTCGAPPDPTDLSLIKSGVDNGDGTGTYTIVVTNNGPNDASGVMVTDTLPAGVTYISNDCGAAFADPTLTWNIGALTNGSSVQCNVLVNIVDPDDTANNATVTAINTDPVPGNNTSSTILGGGFYEIPTLSWTGLLLLVLGLSSAAFLVLRRR